ncbi:hypothetical protein BDR06DRAFT_1009375 [Suillus hirtellus]|nr:hypothetical protein BDR06DRAFT_1009375 [Suillus hirtellus]
MATTKLARMEQTAASKPPILTAGQITPEALHTWENGCTQFFIHKEVKDDKKVKKAKYDALTFAEYLKEVHTYWLPTDWADTGFPDGASYKTLTTSSIAAKKGKKGGVVAAIDIEEDEVSIVAVVMPSAVLGTSTDSDKKCVALLKTPHLRWSCLLDRPAVSSPITISALIDHGSSLVLIGENLVKTLGLRCQTLQKPLPISLAVSQSKPVLLSHYIKLSCTSLDGLYTSQTVCAVITPNLCTPLLLGGPFLEHNHIVIDHQLCTCIAKDTNYDLLQAPVPTQTKKLKQPAFGPDLFWMKQDVVSKLKEVLPEWKAIIDNECEPVENVNIAAAVQMKIDKLVYEEHLKMMDKHLKDEFQDRFPADIMIACLMTCCFTST